MDHNTGAASIQYLQNLGVAMGRICHKTAASMHSYETNIFVLEVITTIASYPPMLQ